MKILHTADIHLRTVDDERWNALVTLLELGKREKVDVFTVSGDLFNSGTDADAIRAELRGILSNNPFKILLLSGNHDRDVYEGGRYFGDDVVLMNDVGKSFMFEDVCIWCLPYVPAGAEEVLRALRFFKELLDTQKTNILLYHGELIDAFFSRLDFGEEGPGRYMPLRLSYFSGLSFTYVLAGHFHTRFDVRSLPNGGFFVYPGSPVSVSSRETGRRKVNLFEVGGPPEGRKVDTSYYEELVVTLSPSDESKPVERISKILEAMDPHQKLLLTLEGYFNGEKCATDETQLAEEIQRLIRGKPVTFTPLYKDIRSILEDDLFSMFLEKLNRRDFDRNKKAQLYSTAVQAMMNAGLRQQEKG